jgi:hypothetical protein
VFGTAIPQWAGRSGQGVVMGAVGRRGQDVRPARRRYAAGFTASDSSYSPVAIRLHRDTRPRIVSF